MEYARFSQFPYARMFITVLPNTSAFVPVECTGQSGTDLVVFEPDPAYIEKYRPIRVLAFLVRKKPAAMRILNASPESALSIAMGTVLGRASPVQSVNSYYMREIVPVDPPSAIEQGFEGHPVDSLDAAVEQLLVENSGLGLCDANSHCIEYPFLPYVYFVEHLSDDPQSLLVDKCKTQDQCVDVGADNAAHTNDTYVEQKCMGDDVGNGPPSPDDGARGVFEGSSVELGSSGTAVIGQYRDVGTNTVHDEPMQEEDMPELFRCILTMADSLVSECIYS